MMNPTYEYDAIVVRWVDGDTVDVTIDLGFSISIKERVRVYGLDCPEIHTTDIDKKSLGLQAGRNAALLAKPGTHIKIRSHKSGDEKFGRFLAEIELADGRDFATEMIEAGHGVAYTGGKKP